MHNQLFALWCVMVQQEGDTALNLVIKQDHLRHDDVMFNLVVKLMEWGTDTQLMDLVHAAFSVFNIIVSR